MRCCTFRRYLLTLCTGPLLLATAAAAAPPEVVVSIKPLHSLVAGVMQGVGEPVLLVKSFGSEHSYSLRPSEARALEQAEAVFWIGETMETFLIKPLQALPTGARVVALGEAPGLTLLAAREGGMWERHAEPGEDAGHAEEHAGHDGEGEDADGGHGHAHGGADTHVWLDPANAKVLVAAVATALAEADPANAQVYQRNVAEVQQRLDVLDQALRRRLAAVADRPFVVFHDAYQYFERRYGLRAVGALTINPTQRPGAQRLLEIRARLAELNAACVFAEPQFEPALVDTVIEGSTARKGVLDPLGASLEAGPDQYFALLDGLADSLVACLDAKSG
jgi:zinc transport system substrate-binding protein